MDDDVVPDAFQAHNAVAPAHTDSNKLSQPESKPDATTLPANGAKESALSKPDKTPKRESKKVLWDWRNGLLVLTVGIIAILVAHIDAEKLNTTIVGKFEAKDQKIIFDGNQFKAPKGLIQVQFWTPSARTREAKGIKDWERIESDELLDTFADRLLKANIIKGYRRYEITGAGLGARKMGAWWVSTSDDDFKLKEFLQEYQNFWKPGDDSVYMEMSPISNAYRH
jgi:hypothetical protein